VLYARKPVPAGGTGHRDTGHRDTGHRDTGRGDAAAGRGAGRLEGAHAGA